MLCSATLDENVQVLAGTALVTPVVVRALTDGEESAAASATPADPPDARSSGPTLEPLRNDARTMLSAPAQLQQHYVVTPTKQRLVMLLALLRKAISSADAESEGLAATRRVIVFMSCTDSVDLLWNAMGGAEMDAAEVKGDAAMDERKDESANTVIGQTCQLLPDAPIYRLHGSMSQADRIASLKTFAKSVAPSSTSGYDSRKASILLCTSVAARGLDLPDVGTVIQLDPPTDAGADEYLHRVGRTARAGRKGQSWLMLLPHERGIVPRLEDAMRSGSQIAGEVERHLHEADARLTLREGFGGRGDEYEARATDAQLAFERWVMSSERVSVVVMRNN